MAGVVKFVIDVVPTALDWASKGFQIYQTGESVVKAYKVGKEIKEEGWSSKRGVHLAGEVLSAVGGAVAVGASIKMTTLPGPVESLGKGVIDTAMETDKIAKKILLCQKLAAGGAAVSLAGTVLSNYSQDVSILTDTRVWNNLFAAGVALTTGFRISQTPDGTLLVTTLEIGKGLSDKTTALVDNIRLIQSEALAHVVYLCVAIPKSGADIYALGSTSPAQQIIQSKPLQKILRVIMGAFRPPRTTEPAATSSTSAAPPPELEIPASVALSNFPLLEIVRIDYPDADYTDPHLCAVHCPISKKPFRFPVVAWDKATGRPYLFERKAIIRWLTEHKNNPYTGGPMKLSDLREHLLFRREIEGHLRPRGGAGE